MKKSTFFTILSFLTLVFLITTAAICNQCSAKAEPPTIQLEIYDSPIYSASDSMCCYRIEAITTGFPDPEIIFDYDNNVKSLSPNEVEVYVEVGDSYTLTAIATNPSGTASFSIGLKGECIENEAKEKQAEEETAAGEESKAEEESIEEETEEDKEKGKPIEDETGEEAVTDEDETEKATKLLSAPTISLEVYVGPEYSSSDCVCYYRVDANVTGNPTPVVVFNKDDSLGALGDNRAQVNLKSKSDICQLEATATNSEGTATESIILYWGCEVLEVENSDPVILGITVKGPRGTSHIFMKEKCESEVSAFDPDGDSLTYKWTVFSESSNIYSENTVEKTINWTARSENGDYKIIVKVSDGKGGEAEAQETVYVHFLRELLEKAPSAYWTSSATYFLSWGGATSDENGFACYQNNIKLEDGNTYVKVLETHPPWANNSRIRGDFDRIHPFTIPEGARFTAKVGFIHGATATDGVRFFVSFTDSYGIMHDFPAGGHLAKYDGVLDELNLDLSSIAGKYGFFSIGVNSAGTSAQDWAVWVDPKITN